MAPESTGFADFPHDLRAHAAWLRRLAVSLAGAGPNSEDAIQETWAVALASPPRKRAALRPWLGTVLRNFVRLRARADQNRERRETAAALAPERLPSAEELLARHESLTLLAAEVARLPEPYRSTILVAYTEDLPPIEIARRQGIPAATVRSRLKRGLAELRRRLDTDGPRGRAWAMALGLSPSPALAPAGSPAITAAKGALLMKASSKTALAVLLAILMLLGGAVWRWRDTGRSTPGGEPGIDTLATEQSLNRPSGKGAPPPPRLRGAAAEVATATVPAVALLGSNGVEGADEPEVRLRGRILDGTRRPVAGALVVARADLQPGMSNNASRAESDSHGRYEVRGLRAGQLRVEAEHPQAGRGVGGAVRTAPGTVQEVDVILGRGFVRGAVIWQDGKPAAGVVVRGTVRGRMTLTAETDAAGRYEVGPFAAAEVNLNAAPDPDAVGAGADTARVVAVVPGEDVTSANLVIPRRDQQVRGVVVSPEGSPLPAIPIGIARNERTPVFRSTGDALRGGGNYAALSDATGAFVVRGLPRGTFTVWASKAEHPDAEARGVKAGASGVRLKFARGASLSGRTVDRSSEPCGAYTLYLGRATAADVPDFFASKDVRIGDGTFSFSALSPGTYELLALTPDGRIGRAGDLTLSEGQSREGLVLVVNEGALVSGRAMVAGTGQPLAGVWLGSSIPKARARTDAAGFFAFKSMPSGSFKIHLPRDPRTMEAQDELVTVPSGARQLDVGVFRVSRAAD
jgi:RNA polymerase sigma-70 factor (ECF subfamily)